jgi:hypothetical protein
VQEFTKLRALSDIPIFILFSNNFPSRARERSKRFNVARARPAQAEPLD